MVADRLRPSFCRLSKFVEAGPVVLLFSNVARSHFLFRAGDCSRRNWRRKVEYLPNGKPGWG